MIVQPPVSQSHFWRLFYSDFFLWVLLWHSKRHLFCKGLLSAVLDVECGRAAIMCFNCIYNFLLPFVLFPGKFFNSAQLDWLQLCSGGGLSCPQEQHHLLVSVCSLREPRIAGGSTTRKSGLPWRCLLLSTVTEECAETLPLNQALPVLRGSEKLKPHFLQKKKLFFPCWLPEVVFS